MATTVATVDGRQKRIDDGALEELRTAIRGDVLTPSDPGYADKPVYNAMHQPRPALIVRCTGTSDVIDAVKFSTGGPPGCRAGWWPLCCRSFQLYWRIGH
jgi:hypothetical protein